MKKIDVIQSFRFCQYNQEMGWEACVFTRQIC